MSSFRALVVASSLLVIPTLLWSASDDWPGRQPVLLILPAAPGGSADPVARILAVEMGKRINQTIVIQNRPGAAGNIGTAQIAHARADGYTFGFSWTGPLAANLALYKDVGYNPQADFAPIGMIGCTPNVLAVGKHMHVATLDEFMAYVRASSDKVNYGTAGVGSSWHMAGEMLNRKLGNKMTPIPYVGPTGAITDLLGGRLQAMFPVIPLTVPLVKNGDMKVLAVFSSKRSPVLPDVPTTAELGYPDLVSDTCYMLIAPRGVPSPVLQRLNAALNDTLSEPATRQTLEALGMTVQSGPPTVVTQYLAVEVPRQAALVKATGLQAE